MLMSWPESMPAAMQRSISLIWTREEARESVRRVRALTGKMATSMRRATVPPIMKATHLFR